uniref:ATP-dependent DNA helicase n=1 Tax=Tanacetum cinerariifolium TaxID=118510 RepID=A0A699HQC6_TANCI|nr:putative PIF1 DNA helicase/replication protein A1-like protein [Tanacetum cinerariifolium]
MLYPDVEYNMDGYNRLIYDEIQYDKIKLKLQHDALYVSLTSEQKHVYATIVNICNTKEGVRSNGGIVLNVASSGIVSLFLDGERTTHSLFSIPINLVEDSMCSISADSDLVELLCMAKLIIWYGAPMVHRYCMEALDRTMRDLIDTIKEFADWILDISNGKVGQKNDCSFQERAILAPTHDEVDKINDRMMSLLPGEERVFYSSC